MLASSDVLAQVALEEVIVTSRRTMETLQTTPISVVAISGDDLQTKGISDLGTMSAFVPNVVAGTGMGNSGYATFSIRGIGSGQGWVYQEGSVGIYIDDVYYPRASGALLDVIDVEQIEVLRGPQGTLFGKNTSGGAIRYVTTKPEFGEFTGFFRGVVGSYDRRDVNGAVNIPLTDTLSSRITVASLQRDGFVTNLRHGEKMGNMDVTSARAQLRWQDGPWDVNFSVDTIETSNNGVARVIPRRNTTDAFPGLLEQRTGIPYDPSVTGDKFKVEGGTLPERNTTESFGVTLHAEYEFNNGYVLRSISGYRDNEATGRNDWDLSDFDLYHMDQDIEFSNWSQEFQFDSSFFDDRLNIVSGFYYMFEEATFNNYRVNPTVPVGGLLEFIDLETTTVALFSQATYELTDDLSLTLGLRWSKDDKEFFSAYGPLAGENEGDWESVTSRIGLDYQITPDVMIYASAAQGYKSGGFNNRPNPNLPNNGILPYDPEELWTYEVGFRSDFWDNRVRLNMTYFYTDFKDIQTSAPTVLFVNGEYSIVQLTENAAGADIQGIEFELAAAVTENLTINASGGWTDGEYSDTDGASAINKNTPLARTPEYSYTLGASYFQPLASGAELSYNVDYGWKDKQFTHDSATAGFYLPSYGLLNARVTYREPGGRWSLALVGTNLTDKYYKVSGFGGNPTEGFFGFEQADLGRPREVGVELTVEF